MLHLNFAYLMDLLSSRKKDSDYYFSVLRHAFL